MHGVTMNFIICSGDVAAYHAVSLAGMSVDCRDVGRLQGCQSTDQHPCKGYNIYAYSTICCCIIRTYNKVFIILIHNFNKEQNVLPEDDLRIETCRSVLNVLL